MNALHLALNGTNKTSSSIIYKLFRGKMREYKRKLLPVDASEEAKRTLMETEEFKGIHVLCCYYFLVFLL